MTGTTTRSPTTSALLLHMSFEEPPTPPTYHSVAELLATIEPLLVVGYWVQFAQEGWRTPPVFDPLPEIQEGVGLERLTYNSPLELWLAMPPSMVACLFSARGAIYLFRTCQRARVEKSVADKANAEASIARAQAKVAKAEAETAAQIQKVIQRSLPMAQNLQGFLPPGNVLSQASLPLSLEHQPGAATGPRQE